MRPLLMFILHFMIAATLMGVAITVILSIGPSGGKELLLAAIGGYLLSLPATWLVTRQITKVIA